MSSFLRDVLIPEEGKEKINLSEKIDIIKKEITKLKTVIREFMKDKYVELEPNLKPDKILVNKSEKLINDINILENRIDKEVKVKLTSSLKELQNLSLELKEYNYSLNLAKQLLEIRKGFKSLENYKANNDKRYTNAAITLVNLYNLVIEENLDIKQLNIYKSLKEEYLNVYDHFIDELNSLWQEKIWWSNQEELLDEKSVSLHIKCESNELLDIIQAFYRINRLTKCIDSLSTKLLKHFINPIVHSDCVIKATNNTFSLEIINKRQLPTYKIVLDNLQLLFKFLHKNFDIVVQNEEYFITRLSVSMLQEFSQILSNDCISKIIPTSTSELETFNSTVKEIEEFQNYLFEIKFINKDQAFLSKYTSNVDKLYIDKKCEKLLEIARSIMKKDLHDSFKYTPQNCEEFSSNENVIENYSIERKLSMNIFQLPECQISKSAQEILYLVEDILKEACESSNNYVLRMFYTSRNIFEMYAALIPEIHRSFLETIPQQVALFHNNCFYLAHHILMLTIKYKKKITNLPQEISMMYVDQTLLLRQVGSEYFLNHMKYQRDIIFEILRESGLSSIGHMPALPPSTERALRQCIRQLELLKTVWIEILPIKVYCRTLGCIVNDMVDDLCSKVINVEDIPADVASELVILLNMVIKRIPQIFPHSELIEQYVKKWRRLKELIIVLGASLKEIEDRWADGKGPLANEFSSHHVKQLIRALFQNTERRANLLSKIKEQS